MNEQKAKIIMVSFVAVVAAVGILVLVSGGIGTSADLSGQVVRAGSCMDTDSTSPGYKVSSLLTQGSISGGTLKTTIAAYDAKTDSCLTAGSQAGKLAEYYCSDATHGFYAVKDCTTLGAGYSCQNGACVPECVADADCESIIQYYGVCESGSCVVAECADCEDNDGDNFFDYHN